MVWKYYSDHITFTIKICSWHDIIITIIKSVIKLLTFLKFGVYVIKSSQDEVEDKSYLNDCLPCARFSGFLHTYKSSLKTSLIVCSLHYYTFYSCSPFHTNQIVKSYLYLFLDNLPFCSSYSPCLLGPMFSLFLLFHGCP